MSIEFTWKRTFRVTQQLEISVNDCVFLYEIPHSLNGIQRWWVCGKEKEIDTHDEFNVLDRLLKYQED